MRVTLTTPKNLCREVFLKPTHCSFISTTSLTFGERQRWCSPNICGTLNSNACKWLDIRNVPSYSNVSFLSLQLTIACLRVTREDCRILWDFISNIWSKLTVCPRKLSVQMSSINSAVGNQRNSCVYHSCKFSWTFQRNIWNVEKIVEICKIQGANWLIH